MNLSMLSKRFPNHIQKYSVSVTTPDLSTGRVAGGFVYICSEATAYPNTSSHYQASYELNRASLLLPASCVVWVSNQKTDYN